MPRCMAAIVFLILFGGPASAGPNAGGTIIVHTSDSYSYSSATICTTEMGQPGSCESAATRTDKSSGSVVWFLAALPPNSSPVVASIYFGVEVDEDNLEFDAGLGWCGPPGSMEIRDVGWPANHAGSTVAFGSPIIGDRLFRFYYFIVSDGSGGPPSTPSLCAAPNPTGGYAAFFDASFPPARDDITRFGCLRWYGEGSNPCPEPIGACCDPTTGACRVAIAADCQAPLEWHPEWMSCLPNPCPQPVRVCCIPSGLCMLSTPAACLPPLEWHPEWTSCSPNPCPQQMGVCCTPDGLCMYMPLLACQAPDIWHGDWTECSPNPCPVLFGACCTPDGSCTITEFYDCIAPSVLHMEWTSCAPNPCPFPIGACCEPNGHCWMRTQSGCLPPWIWHPEWAGCSPNPCPQPLGVCCDPASGSCTLVQHAQCPGSHLWYGELRSCSPNPCPQPMGACCAPDGACRVRTAGACASIEGTYQGDSTTCEPGPCGEPIGACCTMGGNCVLLTYAECGSQAGSYYGNSTICSPETCSVPPTSRIVLISPNGGESWTVGSAQTIVWQRIGTCGPLVKIELLRRGTHSPDDYYFCRMLASSAPNNGSFDWTPSRCPGAGSEYKIRIMDLALGGADLSGMPFVIPIGAALAERRTDGVMVSFENPFRSGSAVSVLLREAGSLSVEVFDLHGHRIRTLVEAECGPGARSILWDGRTEGGAAAASGVYCLRVRIGGDEISRKFLLIR